MYIVIVNPTSGNRRAAKVYRQLRAGNYYKDQRIVTYKSKYQGHAEKIARDLLTLHEESEIGEIIVIGGDGTLHEVLNGLQTKSIPISFIPAGSGNDFARGNNISRNVRKALKNTSETMTTAPYWLGTYNNGEDEQRIFVNCIGLGFDAVVAESANKSRLKRFFNFFKLGTLNYVFAILKVIYRYEPFKLTINVDGNIKEFSHCFVATVNNQPYLGGGMKFNPGAINNQDELSMLVIDSISKIKIIILLITVFFGKHTGFKEVHRFKGRQITLTSDVPVTYQADGETAQTRCCQIGLTDEALQIKGAS